MSNEKEEKGNLWKKKNSIVIIIILLAVLVSTIVVWRNKDKKSEIEEGNKEAQEEMEEVVEPPKKVEYTKGKVLFEDEEYITLKADYDEIMEIGIPTSVNVLYEKVKGKELTAPICQYLSNKLQLKFQLYEDISDNTIQISKTKGEQNTYFYTTDEWDLGSNYNGFLSIRRDTVTGKLIDTVISYENKEIGNKIMYKVIELIEGIELTKKEKEKLLDNYKEEQYFTSSYGASHILIEKVESDGKIEYKYYISSI